MKINFHYCCIKALAVSAGLSEDEAQLVAYASQYVDDAVYYEPIEVRGLPPLADPLKRNPKKPLLLDPICTAQKSFWGLTKTAFTSDAQKKVFVSFHFVPAKPKPRKGSKGYRVSNDSPWINDLLAQAKAAVQKAANADERETALIRLGIALHSYADSWSHEGFSGIWGEADNDVEHVYRIEGGKPQEEAYSLLPIPVGHGQAGHLPDESDREWQCEMRGKRKIARNNPLWFLMAARRCLDHLSEVSGKTTDWDNLLPSFIVALRMSGGCGSDMHKVWSERFPGVSFAYDEFDWISQAIRPVKPTSDPYDEDNLYEKPYRATGKDAKWFKFHVAAQQQRKAIMDCLP